MIGRQLGQQARRGRLGDFPDRAVVVGEARFELRYLLRQRLHAGGHAAAPAEQLPQMVGRLAGLRFRHLLGAE